MVTRYCRICKCVIADNVVGGICVNCFQAQGLTMSFEEYQAIFSYADLVAEESVENESAYDNQIRVARLIA